MKMASKRSGSWAVTHASHVDHATGYERHLYEEARPFDRNDLPAYREWYQKIGMASVYLFGMHVRGLSHTTPVVRDENARPGYIPSGSLITRNVITLNSKRFKLFIEIYLLYSYRVYRHCVGFENWHRALPCSSPRGGEEWVRV